MIELIQTENSLIIKLDSPDSASEIENLQYGKELSDENILAELLESAGYIGNGWSMLAPEEIGALTSAPIIGSKAIYNDQGNLESVEAVYWFPNYQVESCIDTLLEKGEVTFEQVEAV